MTRQPVKHTAAGGEELSDEGRENSAVASEKPNVERTEERRLAPRFLCDIGIIMNWGDAVLDGRVVDISAKGMFVKMDAPLWIGAGFTAQLDFETPARIECVVRRIEPFRGMALTYSVLSETERAALAAIFSKLRPA